MNSKKRINPILKVLLIILGIILVLFLILTIVINIGWSKEIKNLENIEKIIAADDNNCKPVYYFEYDGDYWLQDFIDQGGVDSPEGLINFMIYKLSHNLINPNIAKGSINTLCTTFAAKTEDGDKVFARNYDYDKSGIAIVKTDPGNGFHKSISCVDLSKILIEVDQDLTPIHKMLMLATPYVAMDGMNDAGLSCAILVTRQCEDATAKVAKAVGTDQNTDKPDTSPTSFMRQMLDIATSVDEAVEIAKNWDMHDFKTSTFHYIVCDASGKSAVIEYLGENNVNDTDGQARQLCITYPKPGENFLVCTNAVNKLGYYVNTNEPYASDRYNFIYSILKPKNGILKDDAEVISLLEKCARGRHSDVWSGEAGEVTLYSCLYNMTEKSLTFIDNEKFEDQNHYRVFKLD